MPCAIQSKTISETPKSFHFPANCFNLPPQISFESAIVGVVVLLIGIEGLETSLIVEPIDVVVVMVVVLVIVGMVVVVGDTIVSTIICLAK